MNYNLAQPFYETFREHPDRLALSADGSELSYREVMQRVASVSGWLTSQGAHPKRVGVLASRNAEACIGILATAWIGAAYVTINLALPELGMIEILKRSGLDALVAGPEGSRLLTPNLLAACPARVLAHRDRIPGEASSSIDDYSDLPVSAPISEPEPMESGDPGYILYTSGSTGVPKGVVVPVGAVDHLLRVLDSDYALGPQDRVAETAATSFDLSVYNMFATWRAGASLHIIPTRQMMAPSRFIREHRLTMWLSVPSAATMMARMKLLKPGVFPTLRQTFFCGEPLQASVAELWQKAAPASTVINMYGPTEATVMCIGQRYDSAAPVVRNIVAIGLPFEGMKAEVATEDLNWAEDGASGELLLSGPQLALGYLDDPEKTRARFITMDGAIWYRTGDLALRDRDGLLHYLGRIDNQVKVRGYRVELEEIEFHLRAVARCELAVAVPWPVTDGSASGIMAFLAGAEGKLVPVKEALKKRLPPYMVPTQIRSLPQMPMNANGKIDRKALAALLASEGP